MNLKESTFQQWPGINNGCLKVNKNFNTLANRKFVGIQIT